MPVDVALEVIPETPKVCLITLVNPGLSDSGIKVWPAEHEAEKIWMDNARGIERWEAIDRLMQNSAVRGTRVPKPAHWHSDPKQTATPDLKPEDIPMVKLDGVALKAPPVEERPDYLKQNPTNILDINKRVDEMASTVNTLVNAVSQLTMALVGKVHAPTTASVQPQAPVLAATFSCDACGKSFKTNQAVKMHKGKFHKKEGK